MLATFLSAHVLAFHSASALPKEEIAFKFSPNVGQKYLYTAKGTQVFFEGEPIPFTADIVLKVAGFRDGRYTIYETETMSTETGSILTRELVFYVNQAGKWRSEQLFEAKSAQVFFKLFENELWGYSPGRFAEKPFAGGSIIEEPVTISNELLDLVAAQGVDPDRVFLDEKCKFVSQVKKVTAESVDFSSSCEARIRLDENDEGEKRTNLKLVVNTDLKLSRKDGMPLSVVKSYDYEFESAGRKGTLRNTRTMERVAN
jgi:hypothetical protein